MCDKVGLGAPVWCPLCDKGMRERLGGREIGYATIILCASTRWTFPTVLAVLVHVELAATAAACDNC